MTFRQRLALDAAPIPLRLILAVTFLWAGLGKVMVDAPFQGPAAATLANLGVDMGKDAPVRSVLPDPETNPDTDSHTDTSTVPPAGPVTPTNATGSNSQTDSETGPGAAADASAQAAPATTPQASARFTAADFPEAVEKRRVYGLMLLMHGSANPRSGPDGKVPDPIWPAALGSSPWVGVMAWMAALTEVLAGFFLLLGLATRFSALAIAGTMLTAAWLTEMGPAIQAGTATLGFLPGYDAFDTDAWTKFLWQIALLCGSISLFFAGPGTLSLDRMLAKRRSNAKKAEPDTDEDDDGFEEEDEDDFE